jgi:hypothetical protein
MRLVFVFVSGGGELQRRAPRLGDSTDRQKASLPFVKTGLIDEVAYRNRIVRNW